jgi:hypothetical protein
MNSGLECRESMCNLAGMETVDCQGFQLSPYAADLAEREGIDVGLIKRILDMSPKERIEHAQETAAALLRVMEVGRRFRNGH